MGIPHRDVNVLYFVCCLTASGALPGRFSGGKVYQDYFPCGMFVQKERAIVSLFQVLKSEATVGVAFAN